MNTVSDIMHSIISIEKNKPISDAAKIMAKYNRGSILITDKGKHVGIFTERDILRLVAAGTKVFNLSIRNYYSSKLDTVDVNTSLIEARDIMSKKKIRRLPVTENDEIVGLISANSLGKNIRFALADRLLTGGISKKGIGIERF